MAKANQAAQHLPADDESAVSPVIGTVLLLAVSTIGTALVLLYGVPLMQRLQDAAGLQQMTGQMERIHDTLGALGGADDQRSVAIQLPAGQFAVSGSDRMMVTVDHDTFDLDATPGPDNEGCDFHVTGWTLPAAAATPGQLDFTALGCRTPSPLLPPVCTPGVPPLIPPTCTPGLLPVGNAILEAWRVQGASVSQILISYTAASTGTISLPSGPFDDQSDWMFRLTNGGPRVYAEAWLMSTQHVAWNQTSSVTDQGITLVHGGLWVRAHGATVLDRPMPITEQSAGQEQMRLVVPTITTAAPGGFDDRADHKVVLGFAGGHVRVRLDGGLGASDGQAATLVRLDWSGHAATAACQSLLDRNAQFTSPRYAEDAFPCDGSGVGAIRSLTYSPGTGARFNLRFLHERLQADPTL